MLALDYLWGNGYPFRQPASEFHFQGRLSPYILVIHPPEGLLIRLLIADARAILKETLASHLALLEDIEVVAKASDGKDALEQIKKRKPDVAILDAFLPVVSGVEVTIQVGDLPHTLAIIVSDGSLPAVSYARAIQAGVGGFLMWRHDVSDMINAIRLVAKGGGYIGPGLRGDLAPLLRKLETPKRLLSPEQRTLLQLIAEEHTYSSAGDILKISSRTVERRVSEIMNKLNVDTMAGLVRYAIKRGYISP